MDGSIHDARVRPGPRLRAVGNGAGQSTADVRAGSMAPLRAAQRPAFAPAREEVDTKGPCPLGVWMRRRVPAVAGAVGRASSLHKECVSLPPKGQWGRSLDSNRKRGENLGASWRRPA